MKRLFVAAALALFLLSALHGLMPHAAGAHSGSQGPCVACRTLTAPALPQPVATACLSLSPQPFHVLLPVPPPTESSAPPLKPLRAPPVPAAA